MTVESRYTIYDKWAWLYNLTMGLSYAQNQLKTIEKILLPKLTEQSQILDLCCGTGQLVKLLCDRGYQVTGLDGSAQMLQYARTNAPQSNFILGDARNFSLTKPVDAVISTSASLNHIMSLEELKTVFTQVNSALNNGGWFLFDVNHHQQLTKWWNGALVEGEISSDYAWGITPNYDSDSRQGSFTVNLYEAPQQQKFKISQLIKKIIYKIFSLKLLTRFRLKILSNFASWQPNWNYSELDYPICGYSTDEVELALLKAGFIEISVMTLEGDNLDNNANYSAYFLARKA